MRRGRPWNARRLGTALACAGLLLATAGCGARWNEDQQAAVLARNEGGSSTAGPAARTATGARVANAGATATAGDAGAAPVSGDAAAVDGAAVPEGEAPPGAAGPAACDAPSDAPGVTDSEITLGTISTQSGPVPGLGESALAAVQAYVAYRNSTGGVCGRQLALRSADDGADNGRHRALVTELAPQVIGFMGGVGTGDAGSAQIVEAAKIPVVVTPISREFAAVSTVFDIDPSFADPDAVIGKYRYLYEQGVRTAAIVTIAADQTRNEVQKHRPLIQAAGIRVVDEQEVPLSTLSYDSAARRVANSKADYMFMVADASLGANMAQSLHDTGYELKFEEYLIAYASNFIELAGPAAEGASTWIRSLPNEEAGSSPEQSAFLEWMDRTAPGVVIDTFAADSWAAVKAFVDAMAALPGPITREAIVAQLQATTNYDAGGLIGPIQLGPKITNGCLIGMRVEGGQWKRMAPAQGFLC